MGWSAASEWPTIRPECAGRDAISLVARFAAVALNLPAGR